MKNGIYWATQKISNSTLPWAAVHRVISKRRDWHNCTIRALFRDRVDCWQFVASQNKLCEESSRKVKDWIMRGRVGAVR